MYFQSVQKPAPYVCKTWGGSKCCAVGVWGVSLESLSSSVCQYEVRGGGTRPALKRTAVAVSILELSGHLSFVLTEKDKWAAERLVGP